MDYRSKIFVVPTFMLMIFMSVPAHAQVASPEPNTTPLSSEQSQAIDLVSEELNNKNRRWYGIMRIRWHDTQMLSAGLGAIFAEQPQNIDCSIGCAIRGWNFEVEPGLYGIQAGFGWGKLVGETGRSRRLLHTVHFGWNVRAVVMRTWGDSSLYPQSQTLAGVQASVSIVRMNI